MEDHQKHALEAIGVTEEQYHEAREAEAEIRERDDVQFTVSMLKRSGNPKLNKLAGQYEAGLITWFELEFKVREILG